MTNWNFTKVILLTVGLFCQAQVIVATFSCDGKISGYYADINTGCQVYHMCDGLGRQFSYTCPNATLFQQRMLICDHWYMVNCSKSEEDYNANYLIGQRERPFVEESGDHSYHRTPRPDLTTQPSEQESNIIYRTGRAHSKTSLNLVGADPEKDYKGASTTNEPAYAVPSHWSTEYSDEVTTFRIPSRNKQTEINKRIRQNTTPVTTMESFTSAPYTQAQHTATIEKSTLITSMTEHQLSQNDFSSNFKATTPVYPKPFELPKLESDNDIGLLPPIMTQLVSNTHKPSSSVINESNSHFINFKSNFKATTPVYPKPSELPNLPDDYNIGIIPPEQNQAAPRNIFNATKLSSEVNFDSNFRATTPVYPKESDLPPIADDIDIGLLPPLPIKYYEGQINGGNEEQSVVNFASNFKATTPIYPQVFDLPKGDLSNVPEELLHPPTFISQKPIKVNFMSEYNATTPVYPKFVDPNTPLPEDIGLLPPLIINEMLSPKAAFQEPSLQFEPPEPKINHSEENLAEVTPYTPSKFYEPPKFSPDFTQHISGSNVTNSPSLLVDRAAVLKAMNPEQWRYLRKKLLIPEYEFPLDPVSRPSYESDLSSFQAKAVVVDK